ncbi:hypothetical protein F52700_2485 [Fusarium sp. NRRL 52700]|nr:hypothetical protein F52700_2485 [Fusarium sp. NRRL 52700]
MSDSKSSAALQPRVLIDCPDGNTICTADNTEVFAAVAARECSPSSSNPIPFTFGKREPERHATEPTMRSLACQLDHVLGKMEILQKEKEEIMEKIRTRGGIIRIPKN